MTQNGKGDTPRPIVVDRKTYENNWERIFGRKGTEEEIDTVVEMVNEIPQEIQDKIADIYKQAEELSISIKENNNAHE
jgi:hypothetical protein